MNKLFANYPAKLTISTIGTEANKSSKSVDTTYELQEDFYAIQGDVPAVCQAAIMIVIEEGKTTICTGNPDELPSSVNLNTLAPVYALLSNGPLAVPTGRILVRFQESITARNQKKELQGIGYIIDQELEYAPQAAWVRAENNDMAQGLNNISLLELLPHMQHVEPQMLMPLSRK